jgi:hypothetical protein
VFPARDVLYSLARLRVWQSRPALLVALVALGVVIGPAMTKAAQLDLTWVDNSGGQAGFIIQRSTGSTGMLTQIAQTPLGGTSYSDTTVTLGTTYCYQVAAVDSAGVSAPSNLACSSLSGGGFTITAADGGTGTGTIVSSPTGIDCGTLCSATYPSGATVTLAATPASGSVFSGWSGSWCSGTSPCSVAGAGSVTVSAMFAALSTLSVSTQGPGTVNSNPGGISCGSTCSASYASGSVVTLTAVPGRGAHFNGWSGGGCSGTGTCTVTLNAAISVTAGFSKSGKK